MRITRKVMIAAAVLAVAVVASGCTAKTATKPSDEVSKRTVTASGSGKVMASPDVATMRFGVTRRDADGGKALSKASAAATKIINALKTQGVAKEDIQTSGVTVYPRYQYKGGEAVLDGFQASINVTAKVKNLKKLGAIITALANAGAQNVRGPSYEIAEDAPYRAEALKAAVHDARAQAQAMASAEGKNVGEVVKITTSEVKMPAWGYVGATDGSRFMAQAAVPMEAGQLDVTANVTVIFELK